MSMAFTFGRSSMISSTCPRRTVLTSLLALLLMQKSPDYGRTWSSGVLPERPERCHCQPLGWGGRLSRRGLEIRLRLGRRRPKFGAPAEGGIDGDELRHGREIAAVAPGIGDLGHKTGIGQARILAEADALRRRLGID